MNKVKYSCLREREELNQHVLNALLNFAMTFHLILHFLVPFFVALVFFRGNLKAAYLIMIATMLVDLDHLLATPIYDPNRCSIGFHPLHSYIAIAGYSVLAFIPATRYVGVGLLIHMVLDGIDCVI